MHKTKTISTLSVRDMYKFWLRDKIKKEPYYDTKDLSNKWFLVYYPFKHIQFNEKLISNYKEEILNLEQNHFDELKLFNSSVSKSIFNLKTKIAKLKELNLNL